MNPFIRVLFSVVPPPVGIAGGRRAGRDGSVVTTGGILQQPARQKKGEFPDGSSHRRGRGSEHGVTRQWGMGCSARNTGAACAGDTGLAPAAARRYSPPPFDNPEAGLGA